MLGTIDRSQNQPLPIYRGFYNQGQTVLVPELPAGKQVKCILMLVKLF